MRSAVNTARPSWRRKLDVAALCGRATERILRALGGIFGRTSPGTRRSSYSPLLIAVELPSVMKLPPRLRRRLRLPGRERVQVGRIHGCSSKLNLQQKREIPRHCRDEQSSDIASKPAAFLNPPTSVSWSETRTQKTLPVGLSTRVMKTSSTLGERTTYRALRISAFAYHQKLEYGLRYNRG